MLHFSVGGGVGGFQMGGFIFKWGCAPWEASVLMGEGGREFEKIVGGGASPHAPSPPPPPTMRNPVSLPESQNANPLSDKIDHPALKAITKWRNHPRVLAINAVHENRERFTFSSVTLATLRKRLISLIAQKQYKKLIFL